MKGSVFGWRRNTHATFVVLAIVAVSLLPLRAWCDLGLVHAAQTTSTDPGDHGDGPCCASIDDRVLINDSVAPAPTKAGAAPLAALIVSALILHRLAVRRSRSTGAPPPSHSYYARSARILR